MIHCNTMNKKAAILTLGCKVSQYESQAIAEAFEKEGYVISGEAVKCDAVIINTCTVTAESDRKCRQIIHRAIRNNPGAFIGITGCYAQNAPAEVSKLEGVHYVCGSRNKMTLVEAAKAYFLNQSEGKILTPPLVSVPEIDKMPMEPMCIHRSERTRAYIKIEDGCENHCTYCAIPRARGNVVSKPLEDALSEMKTLADNGYGEVVVTGIEVASYGKDTKEYSLIDFLESADKIAKIQRIRIGSLDPSFMREETVERLSRLKHLAPHFHLSMQSGSDKILRAMKRKYNRKMAISAMENIRKAIPQVEFTTDLIMGFPGETDEDFQETLDFIDSQKFLYIHIFPYSRRTGTEADKFLHQLPSDMKAERCEIAKKHMLEVRKSVLSAYIGKEEAVLFETYKDGVAEGRTASFAEVFCPSSRPLHGEIYNVRISDAEEKGCIGEIIS